MTTELLTIDEAAEVLRISRTSMYRLVRDRRIEFYDIPGGKRMVTPEQIARFLAATAVPVAESA